MAKAYKWFAGDSRNPTQFEGLYTFTDEVFEIGKTYSIGLSDAPEYYCSTMQLVKLLEDE